MCGIAGVLGPPGDPADRSASAARMAATLVHRGPDDLGSWADPRGEAAFGFRRLAILDLTHEGHQPMTSSDGRYTIVFNGEIYNFAALKDELAAAGCSFRGHSDTEVLLTAIVRWGIEQAIPRLWGMFAFGVWDGQERVLHLVRDRLGKKPLYYGWQGTTFIFGSELKALRAHPDFRAPIDRNSLASYLRFSYVPAPRSIYEGIRKLPPASWVTIDPTRPNESPDPRQYWNPEALAVAGQENPLRLSDEDAACELERILGDAVRLRAIADVPLGALLSGGIDSSTVVALLQAQSGIRVSTFTIGFEAAEYDESFQARKVAQHLGTDHTELQVTPADARAVIPRLAELYDEPFADSSQIPTFLVSELARRRVTVALSGDGGDETFGGYNRYLSTTRLWERLSRVPRPIRRGAADVALAIPPRTWDKAGTVADRLLPVTRRGSMTGNRVHKVATVLALGSIDELYTRLVSTWPEPGRLVLRGIEPELPQRGVKAHLRHPAEQMMLFDLLGYLPDDILVKVDRASMGASLEVRAPLLDHRVVEFAWSLPLRQKIRGGVGKWLLRRVLERHLPLALVERPKHGFGVPIDAWLRGPLREWAGDLLSESRLAREGFFDQAVVTSAFREHQEGTRNRQHELWAILMFQSWLDQQHGVPAHR